MWKVTENTAETVYGAIKAGYRLFDGAFGGFQALIVNLCVHLSNHCYLWSDYGNEEAAGKGIKRAIDEGLVKREDLFITSKLWNSFHEKDQVEPIVRQQLKWWGLEYVKPFCSAQNTIQTLATSFRYFDLFLIHFPVALKYVDYTKHYPTGWTYKDENGVDHGVRAINVPIQETWQALEDLVEKKLVRSIGVSNFQGSLLMDVLRYAKVPVSVLQIEHHPYLVQTNLTSLAKQEGIAVTAYSSFGPQSFVELDWDKAKKLKPLFEHPTIVKIAQSHNKTPAQVLLRWATQRGLAVIPKSNDVNRLKQNLDSLGFDLTKHEIESISALDEGIRFNEPVDVSKTLHGPLQYGSRDFQYLGTLHIFA